MNCVATKTKIADLATYFQRGAIFENLLVSDLHKRQFHAYKKTDFYFWRDSNDLEVDLLFEEGLKLRIAEIKAAETINSSFFGNMQRFAKGAAEVQVTPFLFYGGKENLEHQGTQVLGWRSSAKFLEK